MADPNPLMQIEAHKAISKDSASLDGMTLRDWFAGKALSGLVASADKNDVPVSICADEAYAYADAMIKARGRL